MAETKNSKDFRDASSENHLKDFRNGSRENHLGKPVKKAPGKKAAPGKNLVIVESPAKAKTLKKFLGASYKIAASMGHVRDLPKSDLGLAIENDFEPKYITIRGKGDILAELRKEARSAGRVYLATDPDREGEAISWHLMHSLGLSSENTRRITFNEITKSAVKNSIKESREIDMDLVDAQQARRSLDRIVGYKISPLLWHKVKKGLSAGRVQSVALKLICDREDEIDDFTSVEYWTLAANLKTPRGDKLTAKFYGGANGKLDLPDEASVNAVTDALAGAEFTAAEVRIGSRVANPPAPYTTSTMQQEASRLLNMSPTKVMAIAQQLYEGVDIAGEGTVGLVSYIRTDSTRISDESYAEFTEYAAGKFGPEYVPDKKPEHKTKGRSQDAHEAVRPTSVTREPDRIRESLTKDQQRLYTLIWERFAASQMTAAVYDTVTAKITAGGYVFRASGSVLRFDGYKRVYRKHEDKPDEGAMAEIAKGEKLRLLSFSPEQHFTQPPPRYTEASLVKTLEENGVGRPSTYAPTISTIITRRYVSKEGRTLFPTELGGIVNDIMKQNFEDIVSVDFTARMEDDLDKVEEGELPWKDVLRRFYPGFSEKLAEAEKSVGEVEIKDEESDVICDKCGRRMVIKMGRFGKFLACPGFPECRNALPYYEKIGVKCPLCGGEVVSKKSKKGRPFYGCENNPECAFISWNRPTGGKCPLCGEPLVIKGGKTRKTACSSGKCGYSAVMEEE